MPFKNERLSLVNKISDKKLLANCSPYFTTLQYINNLETQRSYKRRLISRISNFLKNLSCGSKIICLVVKVDQNVYKTANKSASTNTNEIIVSNNRLKLSPWSFSHRFLERLKLLWGEIAFQSRLVFYRWRSNIKIVQFLPHSNRKKKIKNISITLLQISLKLWSTRFSPLDLSSVT